MDAVTALAHWTHLVALALWVGSLLMLLVVAPGGRRVRREDLPLLEQLRARAQVVSWWTVVILIASLAVELGLRALAQSQHDRLGSYVSTLRSLLFGSRYGVASVAQWLLLVGTLWAVDEFGRVPVLVGAAAPRAGRHALGIVAGGGRRAAVALPRDTWVRIAALLTAAVLLCTAVAGPFGSSAFPSVVEALHLGATAAWLGGSIMLAATVPPFITLVEQTRRPMALLALLDRFSPVALLSLIVLVATGLWEAGHSHVPARVPAAVGVAMMLKTLCLVAIVAISAYALFSPRPRLRGLAVRLRRDGSLAPRTAAAQLGALRPLWINAWLALAALVCGAIADNAPSSVAAAPPVHAVRAVVGHAGPIAVALRVVPGAVGRNTIDLSLSDARGKAVSGATVVVQTQAAQAPVTEGGPGPTIATELGGGRYRTQTTITGGGRWEIRVSVRNGSTMAAALFTLNVPGAHLPLATGTATPPAVTAPISATAADRWQPLGPVVIAHALVADPADKARLYEGSVTGVYRSTDGGGHWASASTGLPTLAREVWSLTFLPDGSLIAATGAGIYRSTDGAQHWRGTGLTRSIYTLATHQAGHVVILAGGDGGIYRSDDLGAHWHTIYTTSAVVSSLAWPAVRPSLVMAGINPGPNPIAVSTDGGATWQTQSPKLPPIVGMMSVAIAPGAQVVYAGSMGLGAYVSTGAGGTWAARNSGLPGLKTDDAHIASFSFALQNPSIIYAATDYGVYRSADAGLHWAPFGSGLTGDAAVVTALTLVTGPHPTLYATTAGGLYRLPLPVTK